MGYTPRFIVSGIHSVDLGFDSSNNRNKKWVICEHKLVAAPTPVRLTQHIFHLCPLQPDYACLVRSSFFERSNCLEKIWRTYWNARIRHHSLFIPMAAGSHTGAFCYIQLSIPHLLSQVYHISIFGILYAGLKGNKPNKQQASQGVDLSSSNLLILIQHSL